MTVLVDIGVTNFSEQVLRSGIPVLVEFGAPWCAPCKRMEPTLENLAGRWSGKVRLVKVDVDESSTLAMQYGVMSVPTLILFINGQPKSRLSGLQPQNKIEQMVEEAD